MAPWVERQLTNRAVRLGLRLGRDIDRLEELEVRGRRTGKPRRTPVKVLRVDGERYVVSLRGCSGWVCNLRASRSARLRFGRRVEDVVAVEIADRDKLPVLRTYLAGVTRPETRRRLEWAADGLPEAEVQRRAAEFPVFRIAPP
jgi:deazaflavin-dependent oxidoreductase (nitroreductase family)